MTGSRWSSRADVPRGGQYDARFAELAERGEDIHGEATFVESFDPTSVLDAGCGTGRVAVELARRDIEVVGVDLDPEMLSAARDKAATLEWVEADLADLDLGRSFDLVVAAGNVMIFLEPGSEERVVRQLAAHVGDGGHLVAGFQLKAGGYDLEAYDADCAAAGLVLDARYATWDREPYEGGDYAVSVHRRA